MTLIPTQVTFRGITGSDALEAYVRERVQWLEQFYLDVIGCRVAVEVPHRHRRTGQHVHVRIELTVPGGAPIVVTHEPSLHGRLKDTGEAGHSKATEIEAVSRYAHVAIRQAFDAARRRLQDFAREQRGDVKSHALPAQGEIAEISFIDGYGFIKADDHRVYFSRASVLNEGFDALTIGAPVTFTEEEGDKGPQASTVHVVGKHHYVGP